MARRGGAGPRRRRGWAAAGLAALLLSASPAPAQEGVGPEAVAPPAPRLLIVQRASVIDASQAGRALRETEREMRDRVQAENDRVQASLEAEERELVQLRETLDPAAFDARARDFDRRVRAERRKAQERGALLLRFLQDAQAALASALPRVLEGLRREMGAAVILDAGTVVAAHPSLDVTEAAVAAYDRAMGGVRFDPPAALGRGDGD